MSFDKEMFNKLMKSNVVPKQIAGKVYEKVNVSKALFGMDVMAEKKVKLGDGRVLDMDDIKKQLAPEFTPEEVEKLYKDDVVEEGKLPDVIKYGGKTLYATGKVGKSLKSGKPSKEYATEDDSLRAWKDEDGTISENIEVKESTTDEQKIKDEINKLEAEAKEIGSASSRQGIYSKIEELKRKLAATKLDNKIEKAEEGKLPKDQDMSKEETTKDLIEDKLDEGIDESKRNQEIPLTEIKQVNDSFFVVESITGTEVCSEMGNLKTARQAQRMVKIGWLQEGVRFDLVNLDEALQNPFYVLSSQSGYTVRDEKDQMLKTFKTKVDAEKYAFDLSKPIAAKIVSAYKSSGEKDVNKFIADKYPQYDGGKFFLSIINGILKESIVNEEEVKDTMKILARGISNEEVAKKLAQEKNGSVIADVDDGNKPIQGKFRVVANEAKVDETFIKNVFHAIESAMKDGKSKEEALKAVAEKMKISIEEVKKALSANESKLDEAKSKKDIFIDQMLKKYGAGWSKDMKDEEKKEYSSLKEDKLDEAKKEWKGDAVWVKDKKTGKDVKKYNCSKCDGFGDADSNSSKPGTCSACGGTGYYTKKANESKLDEATQLARLKKEAYDYYSQKTKIVPTAEEIMDYVVSAIEDESGADIDNEQYKAIARKLGMSVDESIVREAKYEVGEEFFITKKSKPDLKRGQTLKHGSYNVKVKEEDEYPIGTPGFWVKVLKESGEEANMDESKLTEEKFPEGTKVKYIGSTWIDGKGRKGRSNGKVPNRTGMTSVSFEGGVISGFKNSDLALWTDKDVKEAIDEATKITTVAQAINLLKGVGNSDYKKVPVGSTWLEISDHGEMKFLSDKMVIGYAQGLSKAISESKVNEDSQDKGYLVNDILEWVGKDVSREQVNAVLWGIMMGGKELQVKQVVGQMRAEYNAERMRNESKVNEERSPLGADIQALDATVTNLRNYFASDDLVQAKTYADLAAKQSTTIAGNLTTVKAAKDASANAMNPPAPVTPEPEPVEEAPIVEESKVNEAELSDEDKNKGFVIQKTTGKKAKDRQNIVPAWMKKLEDDKEYEFLVRNTPFGTFWTNVLEGKITKELVSESIKETELIEKAFLAATLSTKETLTEAEKKFLVECEAIELTEDQRALVEKKVKG